MKFLYALSLIAVALVGCDKQPEKPPVSQASAPAAQCYKDTDCKGDRVCDSGKCTSPQASAAVPAKPESIIKAAPAPAAPPMAYQALPVTEEGVGNVFSFANSDMGGKEINYVSRAGVVNVMEFVVDDVSLTGYVQVERAYSFGGKYLLVVSTGESGNSCPATTYAFTYDSASESVTGKTEIDGCSETVQALAEGNKLTVKKDGKASVFYNGNVVQSKK